MNILVTGSEGFIGRNLIAELRNRSFNDIFEYDKNTDPSLLDKFCIESDFIFHLAGVNRPTDQKEFMEGNYGFTSRLLDLLKKYNNKCPIMLSSSIQAELQNDYGKSKKAGEDLLFQYSVEVESKVYIYRFPNVFGKWCKPNYNSAIATFCYNIAHDLPIQVNDPKVSMNLAYIDDVVNELINILVNEPNYRDRFCIIPITYQETLGNIVEILESFKSSRYSGNVPNMSDLFTRKLYSTYTSYLPEQEFCYDLKMNIDDRGSFTEFLRAKNAGQVSINISKPGITKGNHWHHSKVEKFLVVSGRGVIRFRKIDSYKIIEYFVSSEKLQVVDVPVGFTHCIENLGETDLVTVMWVNEFFDSIKPDTYFMEV